jgi:DdrB-like nuclease
VPEAARLSLDALNARLKVAPAPKRLSLDDLNRRLVLPSEPAEPIPTSRTARLKAYQSAMDQQSAQQAVSPPPQTMMGREQFARALEQRTIANEPTAGEYFMAQGREAYANSLAGQGLLNARGGAIEKSRADTLDRIIANARQQGSNVGVPLPPITDKNTGAALSDPNRDASDLVGDYVGVPLADLEHKAKTARARYNVQSRPVLETERQRQAEYEAMPPARGLLKKGASVAGMLAGSAPSPESLIPIGRGANLLQTFIKGAAGNAAISAITDPIVQQSQVAKGLRQSYDPTQTVFSALASGTIGGALNVAPDIILPVVRQIAARLRKAPEEVTVGELTAEMGGRPPADSGGAGAPPPATTMGPTGDLAPPASPGAVGESVSAPRSPFVAHVVSQPARPSGPQVYQGGIRGPAFEAGGRGTAPAAAPVRPTPSAPSSTPSGEIIVTPRGRKIGAQYEVVELGDLTPSHTDDMSVNPRFPAELQPRARERAASQAQVAEIAGNLEPSLLGRSASASEGAPIIGPDGVVESGNGRVLALGRAYSQGMPSAVNYRAWLQAQGFNVEGMSQPVLVRRRTTELSPADRQAFTREANERTTLTPSASEQAMTDARNLSDQSLDYYQGGELHAGANRNFIRTFIDSVVPPSERGGMFDKTGAISQDGLRRVENALFAKAYEDAGILGRLREDTDTNIRAIGNALVDTAPAWAGLRADARAGRIRPEMDITPALVEAANIVSRARQQGLPVSDLVNQVDMLAGPTPRCRPSCG